MINDSYLFKKNSKTWTSVTQTSGNLKRFSDGSSLIKIQLQSTLNKWNLNGTEKNGSTYRMFHLSEWLDKWNLNEIEKKFHLSNPSHI